MANIVCSGPGPHIPASGILGTTDRPASDVRCSSPACQIGPDSAAVNADTLRDRAGQALDVNRTFLAIASPTNAQVVAQVKALTRQSSGVIRLLLGLFDATD